MMEERRAVEGCNSVYGPGRGREVSDAERENAGACLAIALVQCSHDGRARLEPLRTTPQRQVTYLITFDPERSIRPEARRQQPHLEADP